MVVGAGFAGASLLRHLPPPLTKPGETLLIDRREGWEFVPLAHEVAVGRVHPESVRTRISPLCRNACAFLCAEVTGIDLEERILRTSEGTVGYEYLVLNPGSVAARPPVALRAHVQTLWNVDDALVLRDALGRAWNGATGPRPAPPGTLTIAIVGGGATGVELAGEVAALFDYLKKRSHRRPREEPRIVLFEAEDRLMGWLDPYFDRVARETLQGGDPHLHEERRLFYVAMTRAKDELWLTSASDYGTTKARKLSRFVVEALDLVDHHGVETEFRDAHRHGDPAPDVRGRGGRPRDQRRAGHAAVAPRRTRQQWRLRALHGDRWQTLRPYPQSANRLARAGPERGRPGRAG